MGEKFRRLRTVAARGGILVRGRLGVLSAEPRARAAGRFPAEPGAPESRAGESRSQAAPRSPNAPRAQAAPRSPNAPRAQATSRAQSSPGLAPFPGQRQAPRATAFGLPTLRRNVCPHFYMTGPRGALSTQAAHVIKGLSRQETVVSRCQLRGGVHLDGSYVADVCISARYNQCVFYEDELTGR